MRTNKRYFKCFKCIDDKTIIDYWLTNQPESLLNSYDFILSLGYKKPKLKEGEEIKQ